MSSQARAAEQPAGATFGAGGATSGMIASAMTSMSATLAFHTS